MNPESPSSSSLGKNLFRGGAVVLALGVLAWFVYDAQQRANQRARQTEAVQPEDELPGELPGGLSSSKSLVIEPQAGFLPSSKFSALPEGAGEMPTVLPSTKGAVIDESTFLFGSKSGVIVEPPKAAAQTESPAVILPSSKSLVLDPPVTAPAVKQKPKN